MCKLCNDIVSNPVIDLTRSRILGNISSASAVIKKVCTRGLEYAFLSLGSTQRIELDEYSCTRLYTLSGTSVMEKYNLIVDARCRISQFLDISRCERLDKRCAKGTVCIGGRTENYLV